MNQILPYPLWIGHCGEGRDFHRIVDLGVKVLVQLAAEDAPLQPPAELLYCRVPLVDCAGNRPELVYLAVGTVAALLRFHVPTFLCCGAGMSRAPTVASAALALVDDQAPEECLMRVAVCHPCMVSPHLWEEVTGLIEMQPVHS
jgi:hypothetical protein